MNKNILEQLKNIREKRGISLKELSNKTQISYNYLMLLENGKKTNPSLNVLTKIANELDVELCFLYTK